MTDTDLIFMKRAIQLAQLGLYTTRPNPRVGCVLVKNGEIIAEGWHHKAGSPHAERVALTIAGNQAQRSTAYVSLEPCCHYGRTSPCSEALIAAGLVRVVAAMRDPNPQVQGKGLEQLATAGIAVTCGILETQAAALNPGFIKRMTTGLPWVRCKLAMSLDGRTAPANGERQTITSETARRDVQFLRARSDAIITGVGTILADDPALTVRLSAKELEIEQVINVPFQPMRVILDTNLRTPPTAKILKQVGNTFILHSSNDFSLITNLQIARAKLQFIPKVNGRLDMKAALQFLAQLEMNEVLIEAGHIVAGAAIEAGIVDELIIYLAPQLMGNAALGLVQLPTTNGGRNPLSLTIKDIQAIGNDWRITAQPTK